AKFKGEGGDVFNISNYLRFNIDGEEDGTIAASGSVMSLFGNATECTPYCCWKMFQFCDKLTEAPELPAIKMAEACYGMMFQSCSGLTKTPELPATDLAANCYMHMFSYCDELTDLPDLPATVLPSGCYAYMFLDCSNIKIREGYKPLKNSCYVKYRIPAEGTGEAVDKSMSDMFKNTDCDFGGTPEINKEYYVTHKLTHHELSPATFTRAGNIEYWSCDRCGRLFSEKVTERETAKEITQEKTVIPQINMESITLSQAAYDYDGQAKIPAVSVADTKGNKLTAGADYVVSYANNVNAGTGTAIINFIGNYAGETQKTFTIECDHSYSAPKYLWTDDLSECTAYRICTKDCGTVEKEVATAVKDGNNMKATFTNEAFGTKTMPIPGSEHQHTFADTWSKNSEYHWHA
ncbi:MAG: hypothetical protein MJY74_08935, partial [Bacteroidaceae bacterium]|nr:hypothetical protein [Bacteroidaceae bacterium]